MTRLEEKETYLREDERAEEKKHKKSLEILEIIEEKNKKESV